VQDVEGQRGRLASPVAYASSAADLPTLDGTDVRSVELTGRDGLGVGIGELDYGTRVADRAGHGRRAVQASARASFADSRLDPFAGAVALEPAPAPPARCLRRLDLARLDRVAARAHQVGLRRVHVVAWRDLEDPEAGGSEVHAHRVASLWADAGIDVVLRTSHAPGLGVHARRAGYRVVRRAGRYAVFPRSALGGLLRTDGQRDGLVEIWNGMPFFSPLWATGPRVVFLHHVHAEMWRMALPPALARMGEVLERRIAPPVYRRSRIVTLSSSSRAEIVSMLGLPAERVDVVPPGVDRRFSPGGIRSPQPLVVAVGRLVPVKRFDLLIEALVQARRQVPQLQAVIVGEGYERPRLEARVRAAGAAGWIQLPGHLGDTELVDTYRRAWVVASLSQREGWGMTITEAAACGTPAVASRIAGHIDAVEHGVSGLLVDSVAEAAGALVSVLVDERRRRALSRAAMERASRFTWEATAAGTLRALVAEAEARRRF